MSERASGLTSLQARRAAPEAAVGSNDDVDWGVIAVASGANSSGNKREIGSDCLNDIGDAPRTR